MSELAPGQVYDHVLDAPVLLHECFQVYRSQPDLFKRVAIRQDKRPPASDTDILWCGRTVADVVRLIVRASAKRYFRATLPPAPPMRIARQPDPTLLDKTAFRLGLKKPPPPARTPVRPLGQGDKLYTAFRTNLLYEWQVPLIPHYAPLEIPTVSRLGSRILDFREPVQLQILADEGLTPEGRVPLLLDDAKRLRGPDGNVDPNALSEAFLKLELGAMFPDLVDSGAKRAVSQIACMEGRIFQMLMPALGLDLKAVTIFLFTAFSRLGEKGFRQAFGPTGAIWALQKMVKHVESVKPWPRSLPRMKQASLDALAVAIDLDSGLPAKNPVKAAPASITDAPTKTSGVAKVVTPPPMPTPPKAPAGPKGPARAARSPQALAGAR